MFLDKWYADVVKDGEVTVLYRARLTLGLLNLGYQAKLDDKGQRTSDLSANEPKDGLPEILATSSQLRFRKNRETITWDQVQSRPITLWTDGQRRVDWNPIVLNAPVQGKLIGRGYAERLSLDIPPWRLGIERLWWGRFCGETHSLVWIVWEGQIQKRLALLDGTDIGIESISEANVCARNSYRLDMSETTLFMNEAIGSGALSGMPWAQNIAPLRFLSGIERKWVGTGTLYRSGAVADRGSVVFERVDWP